MTARSTAGAEVKGLRTEEILGKLQDGHGRATGGCRRTGLHDDGSRLGNVV
jgi:hypothetical protein